MNVGMGCIVVKYQGGCRKSEIGQQKLVEANTTPLVADRIYALAQAVEPVGYTIESPGGRKRTLKEEIIGTFKSVGCGIRPFM